MKEFDVFYMRPTFFRDGIMGYNSLVKAKKLPKPTALSDTHKFLKTALAENLEDLFRRMQAEVWSPKGEARELISGAGLEHTSMSVGDIAVEANGNVWMVDHTGWKQLN